MFNRLSVINGTALEQVFVSTSQPWDSNEYYLMHTMLLKYFNQLLPVSTNTRGRPGFGGRLMGNLSGATFFSLKSQS